VKNTFKLFGTQSRILCAVSMLLVIALSMAACDSGFGSENGGGTDPALNGTWVIEYYYGYSFQITLSLTFNNGYYEEDHGGERMKGTFTTNDNSLTITPTHWGDGYKWYSRADLKALGVITEDALASAFSPVTWTYSVSGNALSLIDHLGRTLVYYKR